MAPSTPLMTYQDGSSGPTTNISANAVAYVTPGNQFTVGLQTTTGFLTAQFSVTSSSGRLNNLQSPPLQGNGPFTWNFALPLVSEIFTVTCAVSDGQNVTTNTNTFYSLARTAGLTHRARGVVTTNESLTAFDSVSGGTIRDGVTYVQGDIVLLVNQSTKSQNGLYVVGLVDTTNHVAPLTRPADFATGTVFASGQPQVCEVGEGTLFANTTWKITTSGAITIDSTNHDWYPREVTQTVTLVTGFTTVTNVPVLSTTKSGFLFVPTNFSGAASTVSYRTGAYASGGAATAAGIAGTGSVSITALVAAGTFNTSDVGTGNLTIINW